MIYPKFFKNGQKVQLKAKQPLPPEGHNERLSAIVEGCDDLSFHLRLPYGKNAVEQYPFAADMLFELSADALGLGVKAQVAFDRPLSGNLIRVEIQPGLEMFQRRAQPRLDCTLGMRFTRSLQSLKSMRESWRKNAEFLQNAEQPPQLKGFIPCEMNLSTGGVRFSMNPPATVSDLCLMLIDLDDTKVPVCALAEIIWTEEQFESKMLRTGLQFISILDQDQKRIENYIQTQRN
ncbi:MAG: PilZ domain-containing protein [Deltaproteobacteria bacterium]|nr:PilZ domain-containing protein [Deltaproteobacteria bacterium]NCP02068.1 PilZ domain-containing protein [Deltaproteobacteria bacterium]